MRLNGIILNKYVILLENGGEHMQYDFPVPNEVYDAVRVILFGRDDKSILDVKSIREIHGLSIIYFPVTDILR